MAYIINKSDGTAFTTLEDATINTASSLTLVGRNYIGYGEIQNENFLFLLENFANTAAPSTPIAGQLWFDTGSNALKAYDGTKWVEVGAATISATAPEDPPAGAFWFKSGSNSLYTWNGTSWSFIGPESAEGFGTTRARSSTLVSDTGTTYPVILITVSDVVVAIVSSNAFTIASSNSITGFGTVESGINLNSSMFISGSIKGNADTATALENTRTINGVGFNGTRDITISANTSNNLEAGDYITGNDFNGGSTTVWSVDATSANQIGKVVARNSTGGFAAGLITADLAGNVTGNVTATQGTSKFNRIEANEFVGQNLSGNAFSATKLRRAVNINGVSFDGQADITVTASARTLTSDSLASNVIYSELERVGLLSSLEVNGLVTISSNMTVAASGNNSNITANKILKLTADDGASTSVVDLISPATSVSAGYGAKGAIIPTVDQALDLGKSARKWDNVHANTFNGDLVGNADTATSATTATNIAGGALGSLVYQTASGTTSLLPVGAAGQVLVSTGSNIQWQAAGGVANFVWSTITSDSGFTVANTSNDNLSILGGTGISTSISGDTLTVSNDANIFSSITTDSGTKSAAGVTDNLSIRGGWGITTAVSGSDVIVTRSVDTYVLTTAGGTTNADLTTGNFNHLKISISGDTILNITQLYEGLYHGIIFNTDASNPHTFTLQVGGSEVGSITMLAQGSSPTGIQPNLTAADTVGFIISASDSPDTFWVRAFPLG